MNDTLKLLAQLQALDNQIRALESERKNLPSKLTTRQHKVAEHTQAFEAKTKQSKDAQRDVDRRDLDVRSLEVDINKLKVQLNTVKTNREYAALLTEIRTKETDKSRIEDQVLAAMASVDELRAECKAIAAQLDSEKTALAAESRDIERAIAQVDDELKAKRAERDAQAAKVDKLILGIYDRLLRNRDGVAIATVKEEVVGAEERYTCLGCHMSITAQTMNRLMYATELVHCHSCGRILYLSS
jgi:predicted  nucleic acid-binding Zn-ribbon protein